MIVMYVLGWGLYVSDGVWKGSPLLLLRVRFCFQESWRLGVGEQVDINPNISTS